MCQGKARDLSFEASLELLLGHEFFSHCFNPGVFRCELCQQLRKLQPNVPIVYYSAYADDALQREALSRCGDAYLQKPVFAAELEQTIAGLLNRKEHD